MHDKTPPPGEGWGRFVYHQGMDALFGVSKTSAWVHPGAIVTRIDGGYMVEALFEDRFRQAPVMVGSSEAMDRVAAILEPMAL